jgi:hypothetical protein
MVSMLRALLALILVLLPSATWADDASLLGPSSTTGPSSTQSQSLLQPASPSTLQPTGTAGSSSTDDSQALQQTASSDSVKLLVQGEGDSPKQVGGQSVDLTWLYLVVALLLISSGVYMVEKRRLRQSSTPNTP